MGKKEMIKDILERLHKGESTDKILSEYRDVLKDLTPPQIARIEQELISEGMDPDKVRKFCSVHLAIFRESIDRAEVKLPPWHPINILLKEHKYITDLVRNLRPEVVGNLKATESHYLREENVLFPYLEKHGIVQPPKIMWAEHDEIRKVEKDLRDKFTEELKTRLNDLLLNHFYKENNILFPTGLDVIPDDEWLSIRTEFDEIGYFAFTPEGPPEKEKVETKIATRMINLPTGSLTEKELEAFLNALPVDITFVDSKDEVRYFSESKDRIFVRTRAVIGRKVQQCHPQKSVHIVNRILDDLI
ncbi:MAG TPA: DUF438 domain-containing protein [bacterium (Candidatus Stahlbacteria)]|nr:DUF438 domain-containing protein [Candidatus Stahlbacteria bacterium]